MTAATCSYDTPAVKSSYAPARAQTKTRKYDLKDEALLEQDEKNKTRKTDPARPKAKPIPAKLNSVIVLDSDVRMTNRFLNN